MPGVALVPQEDLLAVVLSMLVRHPGTVISTDLSPLLFTDVEQMYLHFFSHTSSQLGVMCKTKLSRVDPFVGQ